MAKKKKVKSKQKKNLNKVVHLDEFRESAKGEDLDQYSVEELEDLRLQLPPGDLLWKMIILHLVEDYHTGGDIQHAWETLEELLNHIMGAEKGGRSASALSLQTNANLLAFVKAADLRYALEAPGNTTGTARWLSEAIAMMQHYDHRQGTHQPLPAEWVVITEEMMKLSSILGNNEKVLEIYRTLGRLCKGGIPHHLAGFAAFNLKEYDFAAKCWEKMSRTANDPHVLVYATVARQADHGIIPPFTIDYEAESAFIKTRYDQTLEVLDLKDSQEEMRHQLAATHFKEITGSLARGVGLFAMLAEFYEAVEDGFIKQASFVADTLLINTGAWGLQLFRNLSQDTNLPQALKEEMNHLLESEAAPAEEITLYGQTYRVDFEDKRLNATYDIASELRRRKRDDEAKDMILQAMNGKKATSPELVMLLASLESTREQWQVTLDLMTELEKALPRDLAVLYNKVLAYSKMKKWEIALEVLDEMKLVVEVEEAQGAELSSHYSPKALESLEKSILRGQGKVGRMENGVLINPDNPDNFDSGENSDNQENPESRADLAQLSAKEMRGIVETKNLPKNTSLRRGIKNMPVEWVRYVCRQHNLPVDGLREDLEPALEAALMSPEVLKEALDSLDAAEEKVLRYLVEKGGTAGTSYLVRTYGSMEEDGYFWEEGDIPSSTLGRLWSKCLIMIGRGLVNGKRQKVALIPTDLLPHIENHFNNNNINT